jgi:acyl-CoA thioesterase-1
MGAAMTVSGANGALAQSAAASYSLVVLGDSITAGFGLTRADAYPTVLEKLLRAQGYDVRLINAGVSGDTIAAGLARADWSVPKWANGVLVALGGNDLLQGLDPAASRRALEQILVKLQARKLDLGLAGMRAGGNWGAGYAKAFDAMYPELAKRFNAPLYPFLLEGVALEQRLNQADGIHPNTAGARLLAERLAPFVAKAFPLPRLRSAQNAGQ